jgi:hypothetical protein
LADHISVGVQNLGRAAPFYDSSLAPLGHVRRLRNAREAVDPLPRGRPERRRRRPRTARAGPAALYLGRRLPASMKGRSSGDCRTPPATGPVPGMFWRHLQRAIQSSDWPSDRNRGPIPVMFHPAILRYSERAKRSLIYIAAGKCGASEVTRAMRNGPPCASRRSIARAHGAARSTRTVDGLRRKARWRPRAPGVAR